MPAATQATANGVAAAPPHSRNGSSVSVGDAQRLHPSQPAQPERELGSLCSSLQASAAAANNDLREYLLAYPGHRASVVPMSRELMELQTVARLFIRRCGVPGAVGAEGSDDDAALPRPVLERLVAVVHQAGRLVADVMNLLESSSGGDSSVSREQGAVSAEQLASRLSKVTTTASICSAALNIGLDATALGPALRPAQEDTDAAQLPAYQTTQLLEDTLSLRLRITNLSADEQTESPTVLPSVSEFLDQLQSQMGQGSNSLMVPAIHATAESLHSRSDSASLLSELPQSSGLLHPGPVNEAARSGQQSPAYDSVRVNAPAPASITVQHFSRKQPTEGEVVSVAFVTKNGETFVTASTMATPTRFYPLHATRGHAFVANYGGAQMVFPPEGAFGNAALTTWAYIAEAETGNNSSHAGESPLDAADFRKPTLCVGDFATAKRHQRLRRWGLRPLCFSPDGARLAVVSSRHRIAFLDMAHQFGMRTDDGIITTHTDDVTHAMFTPDSHALVSLSRDGTIRLTDPLNMEPLGKLDTGTWKRPVLLGVTPDSNVVVSVWGDVVYRWDHTTGAVDSFALGARRVREGWPVALSPDCRFLLCRNEEGADISDAHSGKLLFSVRFSKGFLTAAAFTADSKYLALAKASTCVGPGVHHSTLDIWQIDF